MSSRPHRPLRRVPLFGTCLVDHLFPAVGEATVSVLRRLGVDVQFPEGQTCCGQVAFNDGFWPEAARLAQKFIKDFDDSDAVVAPSGSCVAMVREVYPVLLRDERARAGRVRSLGRRTYELSEFLVDVLHREDVGAHFPHRVSYHAYCPGLLGAPVTI